MYMLMLLVYIIHVPIHEHYWLMAMGAQTICILASLAVVLTVSACIAWKKSTRKSSSLSAHMEKVTVELVLDQGHLQWLQKCTEEFSLPSVDKALRILLTYAKVSGNEMTIFEQIRCTFCSDKQKVSTMFTIDLVHDQYLNEMVTKHKLAAKDKAVRIIVDYAMSSNDTATIFGIKRCRHGDTCKNC